MSTSTGSRTPEGTTGSAAIELRGIGKRFPGVIANHDIDITIERGTIHALVGENGAGKSTLMKILYGVQKPDDGTIAVEGEQVSFSTPADAIARGIGMVFQHFMLADNLTVLENVVLGAEKLHGIGGQARDRIQEISDRYGFGLDPDELFDCSDVVEQAAEFFYGNPEYCDLPRKHKYTIAACADRCNAPEINCIALVGVLRDGEEGFAVRVGGGLSSVPRISRDMGVFVPKALAIDVLRAITDSWKEDLRYRVSRVKARLKFMIDDIGATVGASTSGGSCPDASWSFSATIWRARWMSAPQSNSTHTMEMPMPEAERTRRTSGAPYTAVSMRVVTSVSTSSGASPWASVTIVTVGAVRSGNTSTGIRAAVIAPHG